MGLALSSLLPGAFAIHGVRSSRAGARPSLTPEQVDAVMTHDMTLQQNVQEATPLQLRAMDLTPEDVARMEPGEPAPAVANRSANPEDIDAAMQAVLRRADAVEKAAPDMIVTRDEDGRTTTAREALENVRREAQEGTDAELGAQDASLLEVATQCALATGIPG